MNQSIIEVPHKTLRQKAEPVSDLFSKKTRDQIQFLVDTLLSAKNPEGVGLSFPQVDLSLRGFVTHLDHKIKIYLNPKIIDLDDKLTLGGHTPDRPTLEGCLSIPWLYGPVWRPKKIKIQAYDEHGVEFTKTLTSFRARVFLHEYDHLEGVLFTDYTLRDELPLYLLDQDKDSFTKIEDPKAIIKW